jgi:hypothetical protein
MLKVLFKSGRRESAEVTEVTDFGRLDDQKYSPQDLDRLTPAALECTQIGGPWMAEVPGVWRVMVAR